MATRFYFSTTSPTIAPPFASLWNAGTGTAKVRQLLTTPNDPAGSAEWLSGTINYVSGRHDVLCGQFVSSLALAAGQVISGTFQLVASGDAYYSYADAFTQVYIKVVAADGATVRGVLYAGTLSTATSTTVGANDQAFLVSNTQTRVVNAPLTSYTAQAGDVIVVELGARFPNPYDLYSFTAEFRSGAATDGTDYTAVAGQYDGTKRSWIEFSQDLGPTMTPVNTSGTAQSLMTGTPAGAPTLNEARTALGTASSVAVATPAGTDSQQPVSFLVGTPQAATAAITEGYVTVGANLALIILDSTLDRAPTSVQVMVDGAAPGATLTFDIDGVQIWTDTANAAGDLDQSSLPVPEAQGAAGSHTLTVTSGSQTSSATFTLEKGPPIQPAIQGPDADPVAVPNAVGRWVFQDLMPNGLGSYVLPFNPTSMTSPHRERTITGEHTTAPDGQFHLAEAGFGQKSWKLSGYYETKAFQDQLTAYAELTRRWYVIDHRGRAWKVTSMNLQLDPRKRQSDATSQVNDQAGNWTFDLTLMSQDWSTPV